MFFFVYSSSIFADYPLRVDGVTIYNPQAEEILRTVRFGTKETNWISKDSRILIL